MTLIQRIKKLEDQKLDLINKGAFEDITIFEEIHKIEKKLNKLYVWLMNDYFKGSVK